MKVSNKEAFGRVFDGSWFWTFSRPSPLDVELSVDACSSRILRSGMVYVYSTTFRTGRSKPKALTNLCVSWMKSLFF